MQTVNPSSPNASPISSSDTMPPLRERPAPTTFAAPSSRAACIAICPTAPRAPRTSTLSAGVTCAFQATGTQPATPAIPATAASRRVDVIGETERKLSRHVDALDEKARLPDPVSVAEEIDERATLVPAGRLAAR